MADEVCGRLGHVVVRGVMGACPKFRLCQFHVARDESGPERVPCGRGLLFGGELLRAIPGIAGISQPGFDSLGIGGILLPGRGITT